MFVLILQSLNSFSKPDFLDFSKAWYWQDQPLTSVEGSDDDHSRAPGGGILSYVICNFIYAILYFRTLFIPLERAGCLFLSLAKQRLSVMWRGTPDFEGHIITHLVGRISSLSPEWKAFPDCSGDGCLFLKTCVTNSSGRGCDLWRWTRWGSEFWCPSSRCACLAALRKETTLGC